MRVWFGSFLVRGLAAGLLLCVAGAGAGCCIVDDFYPELKYEREVHHLSPQAISLHKEIPYLAPTSKDSCGLTCLDMIFAYHHIALPEQALIPYRVKAANESGVSVNDMVGLLQIAGFKTLRRQGRMVWPSQAPAGTTWYKDINNPLSQLYFRRPVILHVILPNGAQHFVLLVGFDEAKRKYVLLNPGRGPFVVPAKDLELSWEAGGRVFVAYKPPDHPPAPPPAPPTAPPASSSKPAPPAVSAIQ